MRESKDFYIYNDGTTLTASCAATKTLHSQEMLQGSDAYKQSLSDGKLMIVNMADDEEILGRIVIGKLSPEEQEYWSGRTRGVIVCTDGRFSVQSSFNNFKENEYNEDAQEFIYDVEPGTYQVDCYVYMPSATAAFLHQDDELRVAEWWRTSHNNEDYPDWIICEACDNYDADTEEHYASYWDAQAEDIDTDELSKYIDWVFHLTKIDGAGEVSEPDEYGFQQWESRKLTKAPAGLTTELDPWTEQ